MDIAHQLATLRAQPPGELLKSANRYLPPVVTLVLLAVVAYLAAQLTWRLVPTPADAAPLPPIAAPGASGGTGGTVDADRIVSRHPFGIAAAVEAKPEVRVSDAPVTTQPLKLTGIVYVPVEGRLIPSFAQISTNNRESPKYAVGDFIKDVNGVRIVEIHEREVLLNVNGRTEKLTFCGAAAPQARGGCQPVTTVAARTVPNTQTPTIRVEPPPRQASPDDPRQVIQSSVQRFANIIRPTPATQDGITGFKVTAGQDRETFEALGFKDNDMILNVNGAPLSNPQDVMKIFDALADTNTATVTVLRDNTQHTITLDTTRIRSILENRE